VLVVSTRKDTYEAIKQALLFSDPAVSYSQVNDLGAPLHVQSVAFTAL
jgi:hypothetical protein